jgi:Uma2 family endonuclease
MQATIEALSDYEIERGKPMPSKNHAIVQGNLLFHIRSKAPHLRVLPEINIEFFDRERVPDLAIYDNVVFTPGDDELRLTEMPLGLIEILSPRQNIADLMVKRSEYFAAGVKSYWLVIPDLLTIYVFYSADDYDIFTRKETLRDRVLDIELSLADIFR